MALTTDAKSNSRWFSLQNFSKLHVDTRPKTMEEGLAQISQTLLSSIEAFQNNQLVKTQEKLEDTLVKTLNALEAFNIDIEAGLKRSTDRTTQQEKAPRYFKIYNDFVEIYVGTEHRGGWQLNNKADQDAAVALAQTFNAIIEWPHCKQLNLFSDPATSLAKPVHSHRRPKKRSKRENYLGRNTDRRPRLRIVANNR